MIFKFIRKTLKFKEKIDSSLSGNNVAVNQLFNSYSNGCRLISYDFVVLKVNNAFCRLSGTTAKDIEGKFCYSLFPSSNCHTSNCPIELIKVGANCIEKQETRFTKDGNKVICQYTAKPFLNEKGEFIGIFEDYKDITTQVKVEEELRETHNQFNSYMNSMPVGVFIRNYDGNMVFQNSYMDNAFGSFDEKKQNIKEHLPLDQANKFFEQDKWVDSDSNFFTEEYLLDKFGKERTYVTHKFKFLGVNKKPLIGGVSIDITPRKSAEHNSYVLTKAINNTPIGVIITSPEGLIEFCNPKFADLSNIDANQIVGNQFNGFCTTESSSLSQGVTTALNGQIYQNEQQLSFFQSPICWYSISIAPIYNRHKNVAHLVFVVEDISKRKEYEKQIVFAKAKAEESDKLKSEFLNNLSHEIRTPLNAILGFSSLLTRENLALEEKLSIPEQLQLHSGSLLELIEDIVDFAKISSNQMIINKREFLLNDLLQKVFEDVVGKHSNPNVRSFLKLGENTQSISINTDPDRLTQVFRHLLTNALKFTSKGFVEIGYTFKDSNNILFYTLDSGIGFDQEEQKYIFSSFRQADGSTTRNYGGLGVGLPLSKSIINKLGGEIWVNSAKNQGSTFFFTLPYEHQKAKFDEKNQWQNTLNNFNWANKTILFADDIDSNYKFIQTLLRPTGVNLLRAKDGAEAVNIARNESIDLVLMDIVMPNMDGFEATKLIKEMDQKIVVICQSAYSCPDAKKELIKMDSFLEKPIQVSRMMQLIDSYISNN